MVPEVARLSIELSKSAVLAVGPLRSRHHRTRIAAGYRRDKSAPEYVQAVYRGHSARAGRAVTGRVLEIGPGGNLGVAGLFVASGARDATCIDVDPWVSPSQELYEALGIDERTLEHVAYLTPVSVESADFASETFEVVYSQSALQHVRDPERAIANIWRMLEPGGVTTHWIDLSDLGSSGHPLQFLRFPHWQWRLMSSNRIMGLNRWRGSDYEAALLRAGFVDVRLETDRAIDVSEELRRTFASPFRSKALEDLRRLGVSVSARKPERATDD